MTRSQFQGIAHVYGDHIDTDRIIPGKYTKTLDKQELAAHVLEDLDPNFSTNVIPGDILVAGHNFGAGSSREQAALAIKAAGVSVVLARSFARIFFRNAINIGLPLLTLPENSIEDRNELVVSLNEGIVVNKTKDQTYQAQGMPDVMLQILGAGGLAPYLKENQGYDFE